MIRTSKSKIASIKQCRLLCSSVSVLALFGMAGLAQAQGRVLLEEIIVSGYRTAIENNLELKRESNSFVDAITAEDIGKFPDKNVADALQRVPGVSITRSGGEGSSVSVRGFGAGLTLTQLNGNYIASTPGEPNRQFDFNLLPSTMVSRVDVIKSPEARYDEGGVGGIIRVYSRKPFELDANSGYLSLEGTYADVTEDVDPNYSFLYSWKDKDEKFGVLLGYTYQERRNRTLASETETWRWWRDDGPNGPPLPTDINGNVVSQVADVPLFGGFGLADGTRFGQGFWGPQVVRGVVSDETREREGLQATFQWRPAENLTLGANYFGFSLGLDSVRNTIEVPEWSLGFNNGQGQVQSVNFNGDTNSPGAILVGSNVIEDADGSIANTIHPWLRGSFNREETTSDTVDFSVDYEGDGFNVSVIAGKTEAEGGPEENFNIAYYGSNWPNQNPAEIENASTFTRWQFEGETLTLDLDPDFHANLANGLGGGRDPGSTNSSFVRSTQEETFAQIDVDFDVDWGPVRLMRAGIKYRDAEVHRETGNTFFITPGSDPGPNGENVQSVSFVNNGGIPALSDVLAAQPLDNIIGGFATNIFPAIDLNRYRELVTANFEKYTRIEDEFVFDVGEESIAYYAQADFESGDIRGNFGVRVIQTDQSGLSSDIFVTRLDHTDDDTNQFVENIEGVGFTQELVSISQDKDTTDVLPSFNIAWEPTENVVYRAAVAKVIARPGFAQLGAQERLTLITQEYFDDRQAFGAELGWSGSGGNKNLEPFEALQLDIGVEWYFQPGAVIGAAYFDKEIDNFIVSATIETTRTVPGGEVAQIGPYRTFANGSDASVSGIELFGNYNFANGFGVEANMTFTDSEQTDVALDGQVLGQSELPGTSDQTVNLTAFYEKDKYSVRLSYNSRSEQVVGLTSGLTQFLDDYDQIDLSSSYNFSDKLVGSFAIVNLTESEQYQYLGNDTTARLIGNAYSGRRMYLGLNYKF